MKKKTPFGKSSLQIPPVESSPRNPPPVELSPWRTLGWQFYRWAKIFSNNMVLYENLKKNLMTFFVTILPDYLNYHGRYDCFEGQNCLFQRVWASKSPSLNPIWMRCYFLFVNILFISLTWYHENFFKLSWPLGKIWLFLAKKSIFFRVVVASKAPSLMRIMLIISFQNKIHTLTSYLFFWKV